MRAAYSFRLTAAALLAATAGLHAQCIWSHHDSISGAGGIPVYDSVRQRVLYISVGTSTTISTWDGSQWTQFTTTGLTGRSYPAAAYDAARDRIVLFGGVNLAPYPNVFFADTWELNGTVWTQATTPTAPPARCNPSMAYDAARQRIVLFGGNNNSANFADTWEWDGTSWTQRATSGPPGRTLGFFAYDPDRQLCLLFGGKLYPAYTEMSDLWEWNGAIWNPRTNAPPFFDMSSVVFDSSRHCLIVGSPAHNSFPSQTWELDAVTAQWTLRDPGNSYPKPAAFDQARSRAVYLTAEYDGTASIPDAAIQYVQIGGSTVVNGDATLHALASGSSLTFRWFKNGELLTNGGQFSGVNTDTLAIHALTYDNAGSYSVEASNPCRTVTSGTYLGVYPCYANCDGSTSSPLLTANDFQCFLNRYAANDIWANCDGATGASPILTANDFQCFLNTYTAGCN